MVGADGHGMEAAAAPPHLWSVHSPTWRYATRPITYITLNMNRRLAGIAMLIVSQLALPSAQAQSVARRTTPDSAAVAICRDIARWFAGTDSLFQAAARSATLADLRAYADSTFVSTPDLVVKGSSGFTFRSKADLLRLVEGSGQKPDTAFSILAASTSVALLSTGRAMFVRRYVEQDADFVARGRVRPYVAMEAGTLVRIANGWRLQERVNATGSSGPIDNTTSVRKWECR